MASFFELLLEQPARFVHELFAVGPALVDHRLDLGVAARMERLEGEILELPLDRVDTEAMRERRVDLERLTRLLVLLLLAEVLDRPHVVQAVGELDEDDPRVVRHRDDHLAVVLGLSLLAALEVDPRQLRDAFDEPRDLVAELRAHLLDRRVGVLDDVVQERRGQGRVVSVQAGEDAGDAERVGDEVFSASAVLALVRAAGERVGALDQVSVDLRVVRGDVVQQSLEGLLVTSTRGFADRLGHRPSVAPRVAANLAGLPVAVRLRWPISLCARRVLLLPPSSAVRAGSFTLTSTRPRPAAPPPRAS